MANRSRPVWSRTGTTSTTPVAVRLPTNWSEAKVWVDVLSLGQVGLTLVAPAVASVNGTIMIWSRGTPSAGAFRIRGMREGTTTPIFDTADIPYNASAAAVKSALVATGYFATGDITAGGGALPTSVTLTFTGSYAGTVPALVILNSSTANVAMTGGTYAETVSTPAAGNGNYGYIEGMSQEVWSADLENTQAGFLYIASVSGTGNYRVTVYR